MLGGLESVLPGARATRGYFVHHVLSSGINYVEMDILSKFVGLYRGLRSSPSPEISFIAFMVGRTLQTTTGRNLKLLQNKPEMDPWTLSPAAIRKALVGKHVNVQSCDGW